MTECLIYIVMFSEYNLMNQKTDYLETHKSLHTKKQIILIKTFLIENERKCE